MLWEMCGNQQNKNPKIAEKAKIKKTPSNATKNRIEQNVMAHNSNSNSRVQTFRRNKTLFFVVVCVLRPSAVATQSVPGRLLGCVVEFTCMQVLPTWCVSISFSSRSLGRNSSLPSWFQKMTNDMTCRAQCRRNYVFIIDY